MNHNCRGDFFYVRGVDYYRCFLDSSVVTGAEEGEDCPACCRVVIAEEHGTCRTKLRE